MTCEVSIWGGGMPVICENLADRTRTRRETKGRAAVRRPVGPRVHSEPRYARGGGHSESGECRGSSAFQRQSADPLVALLLPSLLYQLVPAAAFNFEIPTSDKTT